MQWITDRCPSADELHDRDSTLVTIHVSKMGREETIVKTATGFFLRAYWGETRWGERTIAWWPVPKPCEVMEVK